MRRDALQDRDIRSMAACLCAPERPSAHRTSTRSAVASVHHRASTRLVSLSLLCLAVPLVCDPGMSSQLDIQIVGSWVRHPRLCRSIGPTDNALFALMASV